jgi:hypothetical protein
MKTLMLTIIIAFPTLLLGQESNYQKVRKMNVLADKKRFVLALSKSDQAKVWRPHFAYVLITEDLTPEQQDFLPRAVVAFERGELTDELDQEAKELFDAETGNRVFNLGPWSEMGSMCTPKLIKPRMAFAFAPKSVDCNCRQTGTNWGCGGYCTASSCTPTSDGCSIFYMYSCNGTCGGNTKAG